MIKCGFYVDMKEFSFQIEITKKEEIMKNGISEACKSYSEKIINISIVPLTAMSLNNLSMFCLLMYIRDKIRSHSSKVCKHI